MIEGNPWGNGSPGPAGSKGCPATSLGLGGAGGRVAPPVENNADFIDMQWHFYYLTGDG